MATKVICGQLGNGGALLAVDTETAKLMYSTDGLTWSEVQPPLVAGDGIDITGSTAGKVVSTALVAGDNITISGATISATDTTYEGGANISITSGTINCNLNAGVGLSILSGTINAALAAAGDGLTVSSGTVAIALAANDSGLEIDVDGALKFRWNDFYRTFTESSQGLFTTDGIYVVLDIPALKTVLGLTT